MPHSPTTGNHDCPDISYYQADLIQNKNDPQALAVATEDAVQCAFQWRRDAEGRSAGAWRNRHDRRGARARRFVDGVCLPAYGRRHAAASGDARAADYGVRLAGIYSYLRCELETSELVDRATKANIVINTIDARGLYTPDMGDIGDPYRDPPQSCGI